MEFKISKYIAELLSHYDQVKVKGLGTFVSNNPTTPAQPGQSFQLNPQLDEDILLKHIMATTEMDLFVATKLISEEVEQIKKVIDSGELVYLGKIGHFYKNHLGRFIFLPEKSNFNQPQFVHPELELQPITDAEMAEVKALVKAPKKSKSKFQFAKSLSTIAPIAVLLLACVLTWSLISNRSQNRKEQFSKIPVAENRVNKKPEYTPPPPPVERKEDLVEAYKEEVDTEAATKDPNAKECIIIVGQFRSKDGARRRASDIYDFGYAAYQDQANGLTRVGIQFQYEDKSEINEMMQKLKKRFDVDSWILKE